VASRSHDLVLHAPSTFDYLGNVVWYFSWAVLLGSSHLKMFVLRLPILCSLLKCHDGLFCAFEFACVLQQQQEKRQPRQSRGSYALRALKYENAIQHNSCYSSPH
jgi:hypothetical protein